MRRVVVVAAILATLPTVASGWSEHSRASVTVERGDTLSSIAAQSPLPWTRWAYVNDLTNPDHLEIGQVLIVPKRDGKRWIPPVVPARPVVGVSRSSTVTAPQTTNGGSANPYVDPWGCEADHAQQWNPSGTYWGKYQFDRQTWAAHGGDPDEYGSAPEAEQDAVAARVQYDAWPSC